MSVIIFCHCHCLSKIYGRVFAFPLTNQPKCCRRCSRVRKQRTEGPLGGPFLQFCYEWGRKHPPGWIDSRIKKGRRIQKYSFYLTEPKNRHITQETGGEVDSQQGVPATVRASTTSSNWNASYLKKHAFDCSVKELTTEMQKANSRYGKQLSEAPQWTRPLFWRRWTCTSNNQPGRYLRKLQ